MALGWKLQFCWRYDYAMLSYNLQYHVKLLQWSNVYSWVKIFYYEKEKLFTLLVVSNMQKSLACME